MRNLVFYHSCLKNRNINNQSLEMSRIREPVARSGENQNRSSNDNETETRSKPRDDHGRLPSSSVPTEDSVELLLGLLWDTVKKFGLQIKSASNFVMVDMGGYQLLNKMAQWSKRNPHLSICGLAIVIAVMLPFLILLGIGLATVLMTLTGFLVLEGSLLTVLSMVLFGFLGAGAILLLFFVVVLIAIFFGFAHIFALYGGAERCKRVFNNIMHNGNLSEIASLTTRQNTNIAAEENNQGIR